MYDVDFNSDDPVDDVYIDMSLSVSSTFTSATTFTGDHGNGRIRFRFRVSCAANFYGSDCGTNCVSTDDGTGHYTCGSNGEKICISGWSNPNSNCLICKQG